MKISKVLFGSLLVMAACSDAGSTRETPSGFKYTLVKQGGEEASKAGQIISFHMQVTDSNDSTWVNTYDVGFPQFATIPDSTQMESIDGITEMLTMLHKGDSVSFEISVKDLFKKMIQRPVPPYIDSTLDLTYSMTIEEIMDRANVQDYQLNLKDRQLAKDTVKIDNYLQEKGIEAEAIPGGIRIVVEKEGTGPKLVPDQKVKVNYAGYLLDGTYFDTNMEALAHEKDLYDSVRAARIPYAPMDIVVDRSGVIPGWHQALKEMHDGTKATVYIPSTLAYGPRRGSDIIKENSILVFDMEVVEASEPTAPKAPKMPMPAK